MEETFYTSTGILKYEEGYKLTLQVDPELGKYYFSLIPKYCNVNRPRWPAHITIVRSYKETPLILDTWGKYEGEEVEFTYSPVIHKGSIYFWLNAFCSRIENIRLELGLPVRSEFTIPPSGFKKCFHITLANLK